MADAHTQRKRLQVQARSRRRGAHQLVMELSAHLLAPPPCSLLSPLVSVSAASAVASDAPGSMNTTSSAVSLKRKRTREAWKHKKPPRTPCSRNCVHRWQPGPRKVATVSSVAPMR